MSSHVGEPQAMWSAYAEIVRTTPILVVFEVIGLGLLIWFVWDRRLWAKTRLIAWLSTGCFAPIRRSLAGRTATV